jgi:hypothetical protein
MGQESQEMQAFQVDAKREEIHKSRQEEVEKNHRRSQGRAQGSFSQEEQDVQMFVG